MAAYPIVKETDLEAVCLIWLDASVNSSTENIATQREFRSIIHYFKTFLHVQDCEQYIREKTKDDRIFLIVNGRLGQEIVPRIHQFRQVFSIYVYCQDKERNEEWAKKFIKVNGVFNKLDSLINQVQSDYIKRIQYKVDDPFPINICKTNNLSDDLINDEFYYSQLLIDYLLHMKTLSNDITEFINICLNEYHHDQNQLSIVHEFKQKYNSNQVLWWLTRDSFIYRLLSKALSRRNYDLLLHMGFFIRDIYENLQKYQLKSSIQVYHGQIISMDELNILKNSLGYYISINTFMSTDYDNKQIILSLNEFSITNDLVRILFEINADPQCDNSKPFANITSLTCNPQQQQVLFTVGSVFKLIDIQQDKKSGVWIINMILTNIKKEYDDKNLISCGHILQKMGRYDEADTYFNRLLRELPQNHEDISKCYYTLGHLSFLKSNYDLSLNWFQKLLKILKPNDPILADTYYSIGCVYQNMYDYNQALQYYNQALLIWKESDGNDEPFQMAECLNNMGCIYEIEKCYSKALACHQQALSIRDKFQADLGSSYNNIGNIYLCLGEYNAAIENYDYAYKIKSKSRSSQDPSLATTLRNMALAYEEDGNFIEALKYYKKASLAFASIFSATHTYYIEIQEDIQRVSSLMESKIIE